MLDQQAGSLELSKEAFRDKVRGMVDAFVKEVALSVEDFASAAPYRWGWGREGCVEGGIDSWVDGYVNCLMHKFIA